MLHEYAPLFLPGLENAVKDLKAKGEFTLSLDRIETTVAGDGDARAVTITAFTLSGTTKDGPFKVAFENGCATIEVPENYASSILGGKASTTICEKDVKKQLTDSGLGGLLGSLEGVVPKTAGLRVAQVSGLWYVSPTRTVTGLVLDILRPLTQQQIRDAVAALKKFSQSSGESIESSSPTTVTTTG